MIFKTCYIYLCIVYLVLNTSLNLFPWCADNTTAYYAESAGEEISEDLQPAEEEKEWCVDDV